jgi:hypothetical protein
MSYEHISIWIGAIVTIGIFTFLWRDNPLYRFMEHLFVGVSAGYYFSSIEYHQVLKPNLFQKIFPQWWERIDEPRYILLIPALLGIIMLFRLTTNLSWISRITIAFVMGMGTGLAIVTMTQEMLIPQMRKAMVPLFVQGDHFWPAALQTVSNWVLLIGSIACLFYFFFSTEHHGAVFGTTARNGIYYLMISFGAAFGATVMGRISLLIGRFYFLLHEFCGKILHIQV